MRYGRRLLLTILLITMTACATPVPPPTTQVPTPVNTSSPTATPSAPATATVEPSPTPTPTLTTLHIDPTIEYQTMDGIGAASYAFPYANDLEWDWESVKYVFDELDIAYVRLAPWLGWWETANDNADPYTINWEGFGTVHDIINNHDVPFAQYLHARGIELAFGVWDFGGVSEWCETCEDWLARGNPREIPPELYPEVGESISAYILNMQENGVPIAVTEVQNEPDIQASIKYPSPEALRDAGRVVLELFDHYGLDDVMLHAPNLHAPSNNVPWIEAWMEDAVLRERTVAVSYHTWWVQSRREYDAIWEAAQKYGKPVWATEVGFHDAGGIIRPQTWHTSWNYAKSFYRAIAWSHASRTYIWTILGYDGAVGKDGERYPMFYVFKHFANYIPPGAVLLESNTDDRKVLSLAFRKPDDSYTVIVLNDKRGESTVTLTGLDAQIVDIVTTSEHDYEMVSTPAAGQLSLMLPPLSIASITLAP